MAQRQHSFANTMGQRQTSGFGVLNNSNAAEINIGLSMGFVHYYENGVKQGKIAYWRPGDVFYTVFAYARADKYDSNDISGGTIFSDAHCRSIANCYGGRALSLKLPILVLHTEDGFKCTRNCDLNHGA